jgi:hypothetical protein
MHEEARSGLASGSDLDYRIGVLIAGGSHKRGRAFGMKPIDICQESPHANQESALKGEASG